MSKFQSSIMSEIGHLDEPGNDSSHGVYLGYIDCHDGTKQPVVEVRERHGDTSDVRRFSMSSVVHALLNLKPDEEFELAARRNGDLLRVPFQGTGTVVCPWCEARHNPDRLPWNGRYDVLDVNCKTCKRPFEAMKTVMRSYSTEKVEETPNPE